MITDRPDKTEAPYTVERGRFQLEMDLINHSSSKEGGLKTSEQVFGNFMLKYGITESTDLHIAHETFVTQKIENNGSETTEEGGGDTQVRLKWNIFGNDSEGTALGLMPYVKIPTGDDDLRNDETEYGVIVPVALGLPGEFSMGWMLQLAREKNSLNDDLHTTYIASVTVGHDLTQDLGGYAEIYNEMADEDGARAVATFDVGVTYALQENLQLDAGCNFGLTAAADDFNPFLGISAKF